MNESLGSRWISNSRVYHPNYKEIFKQKAEEILRKKDGQVTYEDFNSIDLIHPGRHDAIDEFVKRHKIPSGLKLLEVGTGLGGSTRHMQAAYGFQIHGIEYLDHFVECSTEINQMLNLTDKITIEQADIANCEVRENYYDLAVATVVFMYVQNKQGILNVGKALKPGGLFYIEDYYFVKPREEWDENDLHNIEARGMCGVRTKEEYYRIFDEAGLEVVEEIEWGHYWSENAWQRAQSIIDEGIETDTGMHSHFHQYAVVSPQLTCDLTHLTLDEIKTRYPGMTKLFDVEDLIFRKKRLTSVWKIVLRKKQA